MRRIAITLIPLLLLGTIACNITIPAIPTIEIQVPTLEVGEMRDERQAIPLAETQSATIEVIFGAGELEIEAGVSDQLFSGHFRYNVERWTPEISYENDVLTIKQGGTEKDWGVPTGVTHNEWELEFTPEIPLEMDIKAGAGKGELDFTGLQIRALDLDIGAGDFIVRFDEPNEADMSHLTLDAGASKLEVIGIGYAGPKQMEVQGGVGDIILDFTGAWRRSADVQVTAGVGTLTLRLPDDVGVRVEVQGGPSGVEVSGLRHEGNAYVNDAFGAAETELHIQVTTGIGSLHLIEVSNED